MKKILGSLAACALISTGCISERNINSYNEDLEEFDLGNTVAGNIQAFDARIAGDIGDMRDMNNDAVIDGYDEGDYTTLEVVTENDNGAAMHWIEIYGGLHHPALRPGAQLTFRDGNYPTNPNELHIQAMGCAGQGRAAYDWTMDEPASQITMNVEQGDTPDTLRVNYTAHVPNTLDFTQVQDDTSTGTFLLRR